MVKLADFNEFEGRHWETGSLRNYYAYRGARAPHTGEPFTEALFLGISGGITMGYFSFEYEGYDPHVALLTRNTFDPMDTTFERLGIAQNVYQTSKTERAEANLVNSLENGVPPIVWADMYSLPYNALPFDEGMWVMMPLVVFGYDKGADQAWIADRARAPLTVTTGELEAARGRVKKSKYRLLAPDFPNMDKLTSAVQLGIWDCIKLFTEAPPKGSRTNFGFAAYQRWMDLLTKPKARLSWAKVFPPGPKMYAGLTSTFQSSAFGGGDDADRGVYASFLEEASLLLDRPALREAAAQFRTCAEAWQAFRTALLPDEVPLFKTTRNLMVRKARIFAERGSESLAEQLEINAQLEGIKKQVATDFPLSEAQALELLKHLRDRIQEIHDLEKIAVDTLRKAMG